MSIKSLGYQEIKRIQKIDADKIQSFYFWKGVKRAIISIASVIGIAICFWIFFTLVGILQL